MLKQRVITALILAPIVLAGVFLLPLDLFQGFVALIMFVGAWEWANLCGFDTPIKRWGYALLLLTLVAMIALSTAFPTQGLLILACVFWLVSFYWARTYPDSSSIWGGRGFRALMGVIVLLPTWQGLVLLKAMAPEGGLILLLMLIVWGADIGAYFSGRQWGNKKLAPAVSPGKTWAGFYGGLVSSMVISVAVGLYWQLPLAQLLLLLIVCVFTALASVVGDLIESMIKRHRGIKDSSNLLPGHGGVMDRIDSLTAAAPVFALGTSLVGFGL